MNRCAKKRSTSENELPGARRNLYVHVRRTGHRKPRSCTTLRRVNYEKRDRLESCSRDPIGYVNGLSLNRAYFVPSRIDPSGNLAIAIPLIPAVSAGTIINVIGIACFLYAPCREEAIRELKEIVENMPWPEGSPEPDPKPVPKPPLPPPTSDNCDDDDNPCDEGECWCCTLWQYGDSAPDAGAPNTVKSCGCKDATECWEDGDVCSPPGQDLNKPPMEDPNNRPPW